MGAMEELNALCVKRCWRWKDSTTRQKKKIKERQGLVLDLTKSLRAGQSSSVVGVGDAFQFSVEDFAYAVRVLRAPAERVHF